MSDTVAAIGFRCFHGFRTRSTNNVVQAFSGRIDTAGAKTIARRSLRNFFRACVEAGIALNSQDFAREIEISGQKNLDAALAKGKGIIGISAHLGNFFILGTPLALQGYQVHVVVNPPRDPQLAKLLEHYRAQVQQRTIHSRPRYKAVREVTQALRNNQVVVIIADEYRMGKGVNVSLFRRTVAARRGPATLAARTAAAVVPMVVLREPDDKLRLVIEPELELLRPGTGKREIHENTTRITRWLEKTIELHPDQWNWMNLGRWHSASDLRSEAQTAKLRDESCGIIVRD